MELRHLQETIPKDGELGIAKPKNATWMCIPYFCLDRYVGSGSGGRAASHPMRTLLQVRFSSVRKDRDMQQAVCQLLNTRRNADHCFHIAQIWCLLLEECKIPVSWDR